MERKLHIQEKDNKCTKRISTPKVAEGKNPNNNIKRTSATLLGELKNQHHHKNNNTRNLHPSWCPKQNQHHHKNNNTGNLHPSWCPKQMKNGPSQPHQRDKTHEIRSRTKNPVQRPPQT